jgi:hypothetical protein
VSERPQRFSSHCFPILQIIFIHRGSLQIVAS